MRQCLVYLFLPVLRGNPYLWKEETLNISVRNFNLFYLEREKLSLTDVPKTFLVLALQGKLCVSVSKIYLGDSCL